MAHRQNQKMIPAIPTTSLRVQTDKKQEDVDEKTLINKLIKEFKESLTPDGEERIHIGLPHTGRQGELNSGITEEVKPKTSTLGSEDNSFNKYFIKHSMMIKIRADKKSQKYQLFRVEGAETSDQLKSPSESSVLEAENSREERKFKQKVLGSNKAQEATTNVPTTTAGTGDESTNEEFVRQAHHRSTEVSTTGRQKSTPSRLTVSNKTCCLGPSSASDNTIGQSAHQQLPSNIPQLQDKMPL
ncbi:hypothetical protein CRE_13068 [Caenorhabditis remanei]|uniref:Uncharacterized protein n=1 Tax=Caenorhabditis remanei TaxID=31234 RepID=E3N7F7_CAERE|nr:hypothetical protein CRE_13068 [Caenorhabditis remanei]